MRKIPTVFLRNDPGDPHHVTRDVNPAAAWVFDDEPEGVVATRKYDGTCVLFDADANWWARREVKPGKAEPAGWVLADVDEVTGKRMGWVPIDAEWQFFKMLHEALGSHSDLSEPGTYELCGPKINGNPEGYELHTLIRHAAAETFYLADVMTYDCLRDILTDENFHWEGIVWHALDGRMAKLKRKDFRGAA
jgi:hypothetical protein